MRQEIGIYGEEGVSDRIEEGRVDGASAEYVENMRLCKSCVSNPRVASDRILASRVPGT